MTPPLLFVSSFISYSRIIDNNDTDYQKKFGSLFYEFKIDKGFLSSQYYTIYFIRRLLFIIFQVFLNNAIFVQAGLNAGFSLFSIVFILYYNPYKEKHIFISILVGEICAMIVFSLAVVLLFDLSLYIQSQLENVIIFTVFGSLGIQFLISVYEFIKGLKKMWMTIEKNMVTQFLNNIENENVVTTNKNIN